MKRRVEIEHRVTAPGDTGLRLEVLRAYYDQCIAMSPYENPLLPSLLPAFTYLYVTEVTRRITAVRDDNMRNNGFGSGITDPVLNNLVHSVTEELVAEGVLAAQNSYGIRMSHYPTNPYTDPIWEQFR